MVILHARATIKPEGRERWFGLVAAVTGPSRAEEACRSYHVYEAIETPNTFIFVEEWESLDGLYFHFNTPHFTEFFSGLGEVLGAPPEGAVHTVDATQSLDESLAAAGIGG